MRRPPSKSSAGSDPEEARIALAAAEWRARQDAGWAPGEEEAFVRWLEANERHASLFSQMDATWEILNGAEEIEPELLGMPDPSAHQRPFSSKRPFAGLRGWIPVAVASAAAIALVLVHELRPTPESKEFAQIASAGPDLVRRLDLPDGSIVRLNSESMVAIQYTEGERRVRLVRGEVHCTVAKNPNRPFIVTAAGVDVRAVGTAFNVAMRTAGLEVLVTEGRVRVDDSSRGASLLPKASAAAAGTEPLLKAGREAIIHGRGEAVADAVVVPVSPAEIAQQLAWQEHRLSFEDTPLSEIVAAFNRCNSRQLIIADPALAAQRFGGSFRADDPDTFVHLIAARPGIVVERKPDQIILGSAR